MTYKETTDYLFSQLPMYQRQGVSAFKKNLDNIYALCDVLGNPQEHIKCIHIAGTNGKGSVSHMIAAGIQANGYKVGLYTSPHYKDYRERIKINGNFISEEAVISFVREFRKDFDRIQPSFFEITVALAFYYFKNENIDFAVIETGLGGRLDSTNIISPLLSVITNISLDHQAMLGNTLEAIAGEKAGIIKPKTPVIIGEMQKEVRQVFDKKAQSMMSEIIYADQESTIDGHSILIEENPWITLQDETYLQGYQKKNIVTATFALYYLKEMIDLSQSCIEYGLNHIHDLTYYIGRWMKIQDDPLVFIDSAHNEAGVQFLASRLAELPYDKLHVVWGVASDKDVTSTLSLMPLEAVYYWAKADIPRGKPGEELKLEAMELGRIGSAYNSVQEAYDAALVGAKKNDVIIVGGSIFVVAEVL